MGVAVGDWLGLVVGMPIGLAVGAVVGVKDGILLQPQSEPKPKFSQSSCFSHGSPLVNASVIFRPQKVVPVLKEKLGVAEEVSLGVFVGEIAGD